jgi:tRNA(fMet)-specific endonuclease VapC
MTTAGPVVLDTNVLVQLARWNDYGRRIDAKHNLLQRTDRPLISVVTTGELLAFATNHGWGQARITALNALVQQFVIVEVTPEIVERYATIRDFSGRTARWSATTTYGLQPPPRRRRRRSSRPTRTSIPSRSSSSK